MIRLFLLSISLIFFTSCSLKTPKNDWKRKSASAFNSYKKNFLQNNDALAKNDLQRAVAHAKQSADLTILATIYLGECALNISVGINDRCKKYKNLEYLLNNSKLPAYYNLLTQSITQEQIQFLPQQYQPFASNILTKDFTRANKSIENITIPSSSFLCSALIKENISFSAREKIISIASYHGYKKIVLFWLEESKNATSNAIQKKKIATTISILNSYP